MAKSKTKGTKDHSIEFKRKIISEYYDNKKSMQQLDKEYKLITATISKWIILYSKNKNFSKGKRKKKRKVNKVWWSTR